MSDKTEAQTRKSEHTDSSRLDKAFAWVNRDHFLREHNRSMADYDGPLEIGHGQTNSQPATVRRMLRWLDVRSGQRILDVGSGSGWTTALLSFLTGPEGHVFAVERIEELKQFGEANCASFGCHNVSFSTSGDILGLPSDAPFERILVSAAGTGDIPAELLDQLGDGGKIIIPIDNTIIELKKDSPFEQGYRTDHVGYVFVPLIY